MYVQCFPGQCIGQSWHTQSHVLPELSCASPIPDERPVCLAVKGWECLSPPASVSPKFCPRCDKVHWCQNQWCCQKSSHFEMSLLAKTVTFLSSSFFTKRPMYIRRQFNLDQAVMWKASAIDYADFSKKDEMRACWDLEGEHVLVAFFQQNWRPNLFMLNNQNTNNKLSGVI